MRRRVESNTIEAFAELRSDYAAAQPSRYRRTRSGLGGSGDAHYASEPKFLQVIEYARDMDRNDAVVGQLVDRCVDNRIQNGFALDPQTGDKSLDLDLWERWDEWAKDASQCDIAGQATFRQIERQVDRSAIVDGDVFVLPTDEGALQLVEADRARTPSNTTRKVIHGVWIDGRRRPIEYWFTKDQLDIRARVERVNQITPYRAFDENGYPAVFHVFDRKRPSQTRGVSAFAPIVDTCGMFEDLNFAKLVQAQMVSCFAAAIQYDGDAQPSDTQTGTRSAESNLDGSANFTERVQPGMFLRLKPGQKLVGFSPQVPNNEFFEHVKLLLTLVGINLGMPLVLVLLTDNDMTFHGYRGAVDQARMGFRCRQESLKERLHRPAYHWKVREWLAKPLHRGGLGPVARKLAESGKLFAHRWESPGWPYVEPATDTKADAARLKNLLISPRRLHAERGRDYDDVLTETVADNKAAILAAIKAAQELTRETGEEVSWREVLNRDLPQGISSQIVATDDMDVQNDSGSVKDKYGGSGGGAGGKTPRKTREK